VPPGSLLLESVALRAFLGELVEGQFYHRWTHPDPRMEALHAAVSSLIAEAADRREDVAVTFQRVRELADQGAGATPRPGRAPAAGGGGPPQAAAAADRAVVLLSGAHRGPVGPERKLG